MNMVKSRKKTSVIGELIKHHEDFISIDDKESWKKVPGKRQQGCGVYALYNNYGLYYIGKATSLKKRLTTHKRKKKHWNKYSWYQTKNYLDAEALESIILRLVYPPDNKIQPKSKERKRREKLPTKSF
jgi:hypothetical protein